MRKTLILIIGIFFISSVYALGCCMDSSTGTCSPNVESDNCNSANSQFYQDQTCESVSECNYGCCSLGISSQYVLQSACYFLAQSAGIEFNWRQSTSEECAQSASSEVFGACVIDTNYERKCSYIKQGDCRGNFFANTICSNPSLNTTCRKTENTFCYNEDVYYKDNYGNPDAKKTDCNYDAGTMCKQESLTSAICKNVDCVDKYGNARKNGDSWCIGLDGQVLREDIRNVEFKKPNEKGAFSDTVGSRFFRQYCLNGEVYTEPCEDYRMGVCIPDGNTARCELNLAADCLAANVVNEQTGLNEIENCDPEWCYESRLDDCVSMVFGDSVEDTSTPITLCGEERDNWEDYNPQGAVSEVQSDYLKELGIVMCLPKVATGEEISTTSFSSEEEGTCSLGNLEKSTWLDHDLGASRWRIVSSSANDVVVDTTEGRYGNAGIISTDKRAWDVEGTNRLNWCGLKNNPLNLGQSSSCNNEITWCCGGSEYIKSKKAIDKAISEGSIANPKLIELLDSRTLGLGDCAGDLNWAEGTGSTENLPISYAKRGTSGRSDHILFSFSYTARPWSPPTSGDCSLCGADDLPCSEYRCKSLGKRCEYEEPQGVDKGYCVSSNDNSPPTISGRTNPASPIPPFSAVEIIVNTNEDSRCAFNIGNAGSTLESMENEFDDGWKQEHKVILNVPGSIPNELESTTSYPLLTTDGQYDIYIRCEDIAGNPTLNAYKLSFTVMDTPDRVPPTILSFNPISGSQVIFNTTEKEIRFKINEPAECRWDFIGNKSYEEMGTTVSTTEENEVSEYNANQFSCDVGITDYTILNGYFCTGILTNITTTNLDPQTDYYIKCKDQPWLEGNENELYKRNVNPNPTKYSLRPSKKLEISEITPSGYLTTSPSTTNLTLTVKTQDGAENGKAQCKWRLIFQDVTTAWKIFKNTNSTTHTETITNKTEGDYGIEIKCSDIAGNQENKTTNLQLRYDTTPPTIARVFNDKGTLKLITEESAFCKFVNILNPIIGCSFSLESPNLTSMYGGDSKTHTTQWKKGTSYFVKCKDMYGNADSACSIIVKAI